MSCVCIIGTDSITGVTVKTDVQNRYDVCYLWWKVLHLQMKKKPSEVHRSIQQCWNKLSVLHTNYIMQTTGVEVDCTQTILCVCKPLSWMVSSPDHPIAERSGYETNCKRVYVSITLSSGAKSTLPARQSMLFLFILDPCTYTPFFTGLPISFSLELWFSTTWNTTKIETGRNDAEYETEGERL